MTTRTRSVLSVLPWIVVACAEAPPAPDLFIRNVTVLSPADGSQALRSVAIQGDRIVALYPPDRDEPGGAVVVVDGTGLFLMPGLWDLHTHLTFADQNAPPLLVAQGVTGVRDLGGELETLDSLRARILRRDVVGPTILRAGPTLNGTANDTHHRVIDTPQAARDAVTDLMRQGVDFLKTHNATEREPYFALLDAASRAGLDVVGHVPTSVSAMEACEGGQASIDHIVTLFEGEYMQRFSSEAEGLQHIDEWMEEEAPALVACMAARDVLFVPTLRTYEVRAHRGALYDDPPAGWNYMTAATRADYRENAVPSGVDRMPPVIRIRESLVTYGQQFAKMLYDAGVAQGTGSDLSTYGPVPGFSIHRELELLVEAGLLEHAALWASVRGPGESAHADPHTGQITSGAPADLILLRANPFDDITAVTTIEGVVLRGQWLDRTTLDQVLSQLESR